MHVEYRQHAYDAENVERACIFLDTANVPVGGESNGDDWIYPVSFQFSLLFSCNLLCAGRWHHKKKAHTDHNRHPEGADELSMQRKDAVGKEAKSDLTL